MKTVRVGIVGLGIGRWHLESFASTPGAEIVALCDVDKKALQKTGAEFGISRLYGRHRDLLTDREVDAVSVCVPNRMHRSIAVDALAAGKHVLCEKPLADTVANARKIVAAAASSGRTLMVAMKYRYMPEAAYIRSMLDRNRFGSVYYGYAHLLCPLGGIRSKPTFIHRKLSGGGALLDNGVHFLDLGWYLMGNPEPVAAFGVISDRLARAGVGYEIPARRARKLGCDVEDFGAGMVRFANGAAIYVDSAWSSFAFGDGVTHLQILGDAGGASLWPFGITSSRGTRPVTRSPDLAKKKFRAPSQFQHFLDCIRHDRRPNSSAEQGITVLKMLHGIYRSQKTGSTVRVS